MILGKKLTCSVEEAEVRDSMPFCSEDDTCSEYDTLLML